MTSPEPKLTAAEAIAYLNIGSESALYRLIREHRLPFLRVGQRYRFDRAEVDAWMHGHSSVIAMARAPRTLAS